MTMDLLTIEELATTYADRRKNLSDALTRLRDDLEAVRRAHLPEIRLHLGVAQAKRSELFCAIEDGRELFERPRTRVMGGIKVGLQKQRGRVEIADEEATIKRIRALLPEEQAELLIRVRESVHKPAVYDLTAADLKRLGIAVTDDTEVIVLKPADDALDQLLAELLPETEKMGDEA